MPEAATFYILQIKDLELLQNEVNGNSNIKKNWLGLKRKTTDSFVNKLEKFAVEKIKYRWSALAFPVLAVFSKEKLKADWHYLEYSSIANEFSEKADAGIYIFSINDTPLIKLKPNGYFYSIQELNQFASEFEGTKPKNPDLMRNAAKALDEALSKITKEKVVLLLLTSDS